MVPDFDSGAPRGPMDPDFDSGSPPGPGPMGPEQLGERFTNYAPANLQTGGDGFRLGVDAEMVGGQPVVEGYDSEQAVCSDNQVGGGSPFNFITDPDTNESLSIFSAAGKALLKRYVKAYKQMQSGGDDHKNKTENKKTEECSKNQSGGAALLEGVEPNATGALYDGVDGAGAENMPDACGLTYDAVGPEWMHTQVGGGKKTEKGCNCNSGCEECKDGKC